MKIIKESFSEREVLRKLGYKPDGGYLNLRKIIKSFDTSHFTGAGWLKGKTYYQKSNEELFVVNGSTNSHSIKLNLFRRGLKDKQCEKCRRKKWLGNDLPLELNHINGNDRDNRLENLEILCPNCHYFTPNYKSKNKKQDPIG